MLSGGRIAKEWQPVKDLRKRGEKVYGLREAVDTKITIPGISDTHQLSPPILFLGHLSRLLWTFPPPTLESDCYYYFFFYLFETSLCNPLASVSTIFNTWIFTCFDSLFPFCSLSSVDCVREASWPYLLALADINPSRMPPSCCDSNITGV